MSLENAGPTRVEVAEQLNSLPVGEKYSGLETWLNENYSGTVGAKTITELILSDIESYPEYGDG